MRLTLKYGIFSTPISLIVTFIVLSVIVNRCDPFIRKSRCMFWLAQTKKNGGTNTPNFFAINENNDTIKAASYRRISTTEDFQFSKSLTKSTDGGTVISSTYDYDGIRPKSAHNMTPGSKFHSSYSSMSDRSTYYKRYCQEHDDKNFKNVAADTTLGYQLIGYDQVNYSDSNIDKSLIKRINSNRSWVNSFLAGNKNFNGKIRVTDRKYIPRDAFMINSNKTSASLEKQFVEAYLPNDNISNKEIKKPDKHLIRNPFGLQLLRFTILPRRKDLPETREFSDSNLELSSIKSIIDNINKEWFKYSTSNVSTNETEYATVTMTASIGKISRLTKSLFERFKENWLVKKINKTISRNKFLNDDFWAQKTPKSITELEETIDNLLITDSGRSINGNKTEVSRIEMTSENNKDDLTATFFITTKSLITTNNKKERTLTTENKNQKDDEEELKEIRVSDLRTTSAIKTSSSDATIGSSTVTISCRNILCISTDVAGQSCQENGNNFKGSWLGTSKPTYEYNYNNEPSEFMHNRSSLSEAKGDNYNSNGSNNSCTYNMTANGNNTNGNCNNGTVFNVAGRFVTNCLGHMSKMMHCFSATEPPEPTMDNITFYLFTRQNQDIGEILLLEEARKSKYQQSEDEDYVNNNEDYYEYYSDGFDTELKHDKRKRRRGDGNNIGRFENDGEDDSTLGRRRPSRMNKLRIDSGKDNNESYEEAGDLCFLNFKRRNGCLRIVRDGEKEDKIQKRFVDRPAPNYNYSGENFTGFKMGKSTITSKYFNVNDKTKIIIHGYTQSYTSEAIIQLKDAYLHTGSFNTILVDWSQLAAGPCYNLASRYAKSVGGLVKDLIYRLAVGGISMKSVHLIGFSLGAQVAGFAGNDFDTGHIYRITGLDPALPLFAKKDPEDVLDAGDAHFVDIIHTSHILGQGLPLGHADFYPNGGITQPGCDKSDIICSHVRGLLLFIESVKSAVSFRSVGCNSWETFLTGRCDNHSTIALMGEPCTSNVSGLFYLKTGSVAPFAL